jgi:hypothetical protein
MKLKNGYDLQGSPNRVEYKRNENGLYTIDFKDYIVTTSDGQKYQASIRFQNVKFPVGNEEGVIYCNKEDIQYLSAVDEPDGTFFEIIIPDVVT